MALMHFEGDKELPRSPAELWPKLSDAGFLARCVPQAEVVKVEPKTAVCRVRTSFSFITGSLTITLTVLDAREPESVSIQAATRTMGATSTAHTTVTLKPQGSGTHLHWNADIVELGGLLKSLPTGLIQGAAQKVIDELLASVEAQLCSA